jgi:pimeloyl-ACP methyl ester carboxylesterase
MNSSLARLPSPEGPGSVSRAPHLPEGFTSTFTSWYVDTGELRQHVVTGGDGPPLLLLVHGWPQTWYAWRLVMPGLAQDFSVVAADQRGCGPSSKPPRIRHRHPLFGRAGTAAPRNPGTASAHFG